MENPNEDYNKYMREIRAGYRQDPEYRKQQAELSQVNNIFIIIQINVCYIILCFSHMCIGNCVLYVVLRKNVYNFLHK